MSLTVYTVVLEGNDTVGWSGVVPDLPGVLLAGNTKAELLDRAPAVLADHLAALRDCGLPIPKLGEHVAQVAVVA